MQPVWHCLVHTYSADSINLTNSKCWFMPPTTVHAGCEFGRLIYVLALNVIFGHWKSSRGLKHWVFATYFGGITFQRLFMLSANWPIAVKFHARCSTVGLSQHRGYQKTSENWKNDDELFDFRGTNVRILCEFEASLLRIWIGFCAWLLEAVPADSNRFEVIPSRLQGWCWTGVAGFARKKLILMTWRKFLAAGVGRLVVSPAFQEVPLQLEGSNTLSIHPRLSVHPSASCLAWNHRRERLVNQKLTTGIFA